MANYVEVLKVDQLTEGQGTTVFVNERDMPCIVIRDSYMRWIIPVSTARASSATAG